jgi:SOS response regulatory protein OraA/RecX
VHREGETVRLEIADGTTYELAASSVPPDLPPAGGELSADQHRAVALASERKRAARRLFSLLDRKLQPVAKLRGRLLDEGYLPEAVAAVIDAMHEQGVHSDRRFAEAWCRDYLLSRAVGRRYLESRLRTTGISADLARQASLDALDARTEEDLAQRAAAGAWRRVRGNEQRDLAKVVRFLVGRGFPPALAQRVARQARPAPGTGRGREPGAGAGIDGAADDLVDDPDATVDADDEA